MCSIEQPKDAAAARSSVHTSLMRAERLLTNVTGPILLNSSESMPHGRQ
jgi:hypothetical protein